MKINKKDFFIIILSFLVILLSMLLFLSLFKSNENTNLAKPDLKEPQGASSNVLDMGVIDYNFKEDEVNFISNRASFEEYTKENISMLSKEPAVLGGTFFVTNIEWLDYNLALVDYEDGHIALQAKAKYDLASNGSVLIKSFEIVPDSDANNEYILNEGALQSNPDSEPSKAIKIEASLPSLESIDW